VILAGAVGAALFGFTAGLVAGGICFVWTVYRLIRAMREL